MAQRTGMGTSKQACIKPTQPKQHNTLSALLFMGMEKKHTPHKGMSANLLTCTDTQLRRHPPRHAIYFCGAIVLEDKRGLLELGRMGVVVLRVPKQQAYSSQDKTPAPALTIFCICACMYV